MTLKQLDYFFHLCSDPSISSITRKIDVSQPAISLSIKALEDELGEQLFSRIGKKLILNERGRIFRDHTWSHFLALKDAGTMFRSKSIAGTLHISASKTFNSYCLPQAIFNFHRKYPSAIINKRSENSSAIINSLNTGKSDIGFLESSFDEPDLIRKKIAEDELIVVSSDKGLARENHYIDTLLDRLWILRETGSGTRDIFLAKLAEINLKPDIFIEMPEFEEIKSILLENKETLTCISRQAVKRELIEGNLFHVKLKNLRFKRDLFVAYHRSRYKTVLFRKFMEFSENSLCYSK